MTNHELDVITRNWVGHIATDEDVRTALNDVLNLKKGVNAAMARLINKTVVPKKPVKAADVPRIIEITSKMFKGGRLPETSTTNFGILQQSGGHPVEDQ